MRESLAVADIAMQRMREALRPGLSENQLWAELHYANIAHGGEWIGTRLLSSGPRSNPWFQEASRRRIEAGDGSTDPRPIRSPTTGSCCVRA